MDAGRLRGQKPRRGVRPAPGVNALRTTVAAAAEAGSRMEPFAGSWRHDGFLQTETESGSGEHS